MTGERKPTSVFIELDGEHEPEETIRYVAEQIQSGMTSGYYPTWNLNYEEES